MLRENGQEEGEEWEERDGGGGHGGMMWSDCRPSCQILSHLPYCKAAGVKCCFARSQQDPCSPPADLTGRPTGNTRTLFKVKHSFVEVPILLLLSVASGSSISLTGSSTRSRSQRPTTTTSGSSRGRKSLLMLMAAAMLHGSPAQMRLGDAHEFLSRRS